MLNVAIKIDELENNKTLSNEILTALYEQKLLKVFVPDILGGLGKNLIDGLKIFRQMGQLDGNIGWAVTIGSGGNMFLPLFQHDVGKIYFEPENAVISGSGKPNGTAHKVEGGYIVSGSWRYCSGADYGTTFTMNTINEENGEIVTCSVKRGDVTIIQDWQAIGLKATASHTIQLENVFVKDTEIFQFDQIQNNYNLPVHTFPFLTFSESSFFSLVIGMAHNVLTKQQKALNEKFNEEHSRYQIVSEKIQQAQTIVDQIEVAFDAEIETLWQQHTQLQIDEQLVSEFSQFCQTASSELLSELQLLMRYFGMEAVLETSELSYSWRNFCTASQHAFLTP
ncbi:acyl-CoA dehydrogenase [Solibacillus sp. R5-41]|uniref:acyl-CoA dehydrogenase n=1 Tax=Solibacillus sp. R5-41 TaxID=2048654 RepID=UPI000C12857F|nr:acyl-CoA dehydrogenase [Solibacillus sp. R5-41]ATP42304.1 acyl-CoA dehydrogenase [Solibacillus sp. R5-41]